jgi:hypothetical protein
MTWLKLLASPYLHLWWGLFLGYLVCWGVAWALATAGRHGTNIVQRCRQAWALVFGVHLLFVIGLTGVWWQRFGYFKNFIGFLLCYLLLVLIDLILLVKLRAASRA